MIILVLARIVEVFVTISVFYCPLLNNCRIELEVVPPFPQSVQVSMQIIHADWLREYIFSYVCPVV